MTESYTILYVDDDKDDLALIAEAFEKYTKHLRVVHAANGLEGLDALQAMNQKGSLPCLIILDINMPVMNGKEMLRHVRNHPDYKAIPVVMFSTSCSSNDKAYAASLEADFISKPNTYKDMEALVTAFISKCSLELEKIA